MNLLDGKIIPCFLFIFTTCYANNPAGVVVPVHFLYGFWPQSPLYLHYYYYLMPYRSKITFRRGTTQDYPDTYIPNHPIHKTPVEVDTATIQDDSNKCGVTALQTAKQQVVQVSKFLRKESLHLESSSEEEESEEIQSEKVTRANGVIETDPPNLSKAIFYRYLSGMPSLLDLKITFGKATQMHEYPWQVAIFDGKKFHCGASIIDEQFVLTAAHCVTRFQNSPERMRLIVGDWNLDSVDDGKHIERKADKIVIHPSYSSILLKGDIAIVRLKNKIKFSPSIRKICLPPEGTAVEEKLITVTGWGRNEFQRLSPKLQKLSAFSIQNKACGKKWALVTGAPSDIIDRNAFCMNTQVGDSCKGDSGGPAVMIIGGKFFQMGIVSFGAGSCMDKSLPGVYMRVSSYVHWIEDQMKKLRKKS